MRFKRCLPLIHFALAYYTSAYYYDEASFFTLQRLRDELETGVNLNDTNFIHSVSNRLLKKLFFLALKNYQVNAKSASEIEYPWIARVLHSRQHSHPQLCTAICIDNQIFVTAARCVYTLKIHHTSLIYQDHRLTAKAFVIPSKESKQMYDDIGFIIANDEFGGDWKTLEVFDQKRTDGSYQWFGNMTFDEFEHRVVGYARFKNDDSVFVWKRPYYLTQLDVHVDINLCREILVYHELVEAFGVPCYHSCTLSQFKGQEAVNRNERCKNYHGSEGSAIINLKTNKLHGVATWGPYFKKYELPVGFAIPNSDNFHEDLACAVKIREDQEISVPEGYYQKLCDVKRKSIGTFFRENVNKQW